MSIKTVLFDLDGTLLPMDQEVFVKAYFGGICKKLAPYGYEADKLVNALWMGTKDMVKNDGSQTNEDVFWKRFCQLLGENTRETEPILEEFYHNEFHQVKSVCGYDSAAAQVIARLKEKGLQVVLATNPIFPAIATQGRMRWAGLKPEDFALYTTYENSSYCKPNLNYYRQILEKLDLVPEECVMVGNDVAEDMIAEELGMQVFLLTGCMINRENKDISHYRQGGFPELLQFVEEL